jgi:hypothetical protein
MWRRVALVRTDVSEESIASLAALAVTITLKYFISHAVITCTQRAIIANYDILHSYRRW